MAISRWRPGRHDLDKIDPETGENLCPDDCEPCETCVKCEGWPDPLPDSCWIDHRGTWNITPGSGADGGGTDAILLTKASFSDAHGITAQMGTAGRLILCFRATVDGETYIYANLTAATGSGFAEIFHVVDDVPTSVGSASYSNITNGLWTFCYSNGRAILSNVDVVLAVDVTEQPAQSGLGVAVGQTAVSFSEPTRAYQADGSREECPTCIEPIECGGCDSGSESLGETMTMELTDVYNPGGLKCAGIVTPYIIGM